MSKLQQPIEKHSSNPLATGNESPGIMITSKLTSRKQGNFGETSYMGNYYIIVNTKEEFQRVK